MSPIDEVAQPPAILGRRFPLLLPLLVYGTLFGLVLLGWLAYAVRQPSVLAYAYRYDFVSAYIGARAVVTGQGSHLYDLDLQRRLTTAALAPYTRPLLLPYIYPGYVAVLIAPLGWLSYAGAFVTWSLVNLVAAGWAIGRLVRATVRPAGERLVLFLVAASFMPLLLGLLQGQFQILPLLGLVEAILALRAGHDRRAGAWLLLGLTKPHLVLLPLFVLLLWRRWRALAVFAAGALLVSGLALLFLGNWLAGYIAFLVELTRQGPALADYPVAMHNWRGLLFVLLGDNSPFAWGVLLALDVASVLLLAWVCRSPAGRPSPDRAGSAGLGPAGEICFALAILLGLLVSPHLYLHDAVVALPAGFILWRATLVTPSTSWRLTALRWLLAVGPLAAVLAQFVSPAFGVIQIGPWYLILLVLAVLGTWDLRHATGLTCAVRAKPG